jgi:cyclophilin family peptidyl-prolyl cis-trans isomerase
VAKLAVAPLLATFAEEDSTGRSVLAAVRSDLGFLLDSPDPILRAVAIDAIASALPDSMASAQRDAWLRLLEQTWRNAHGAPGNDLLLTILSPLESYVGFPIADRILQEAREHPDELVRREAVRILRAKNPRDASLESRPVETRRSIEEYASILRWTEQTHHVEIKTERGNVLLELFAEAAPLTCWNFTRLAESGYYDGGSWHRIVPNFVVQDGCPRGDGWGGPGYQIRCEISEHRYETGTLGMALSGKDTGGSQFFITHSPQPHLDGRYTVFGKVIEGQAVVDRLIQGDRIEAIRLVSAR